jgi:RND family efflux transporter MFP subunit
MKLLALAAAIVCASSSGLLGCHKHDHADGHGHDHGSKDEGAAEEPEPIAITRWTDDYELFVELPPPAPGKPIPYHAHVTRLSDFFAVTEGTFRVRFKTASGVALEAAQTGAKRPGIFVFESPAPPAGVYALEMSYDHDGKTDVWDCGSITVADKPPPAEEEAAAANITFLKESQWKIPFGTAWAQERPLAKEMELAAIIEPAATDQLTLGAPTGGRFFHNPKLAVAEGLRIKKGDVLGSIAPTVAGDDFSRLQSAVEEARLAKEQTEREIERVEPLVKQNLLPERRLVELRNDLESHTARLKSAGGRLGRVVAPGGEGGLTIKSTLEGVVSQVLVPNGEPVEAGAPLVRIGGTDHLWIRARFVAKPASTLLDAKPTAVRLPSGEQIDLEKSGARFLSSLPVVDPASRVATWIVDVAPPGRDATASEKSPPNLRPGSSVVLSVRFGEPKTLLAVPREAVVEINTRPYVFVQTDGEHFEKRPVTLGQADGPWVHIASGVAKGERIVTKGGFDIHLAALMGTVESHRH